MVDTLQFIIINNFERHCYFVCDSLLVVSLCFSRSLRPCFHYVHRVPVRVGHVATGESSKELAKPNLWILAILAKSVNNFLFLDK